MEDEDGHWYTVPVELKNEFDRLLEGGEDCEDEFNRIFSPYSVGGCPSRIEFTLD